MNPALLLAPLLAVNAVEPERELVPEPIPALPAAREPPSPLGGERDVDRLGWFIPDFAKLQTGGYAGSATIGLGYAAFDDVLNAALLYGYTPSGIAGDTVSSIELTLSARPFDLRLPPFRFVPIYAGAGALFTWGDGYYQSLPDRYEAGYYPATGRHWTFHLGTEADWLPAGGAVERHGLYLELVTLDTFAGRYLRNPETLSPADVLALALGYRVAF